MDLARMYIAFQSLTIVVQQGDQQEGRGAVPDRDSFMLMRQRPDNHVIAQRPISAKTVDMTFHTGPRPVLQKVKRVIIAGNQIISAAAAGSVGNNVYRRYRTYRQVRVMSTPITLARRETERRQQGFN